MFAKKLLLAFSLYGSKEEATESSDFRRVTFAETYVQLAIKNSFELRKHHPEVGMEKSYFQVLREEGQFWDALNANQLPLLQTALFELHQDGNYNDDIQEELIANGLGEAVISLGNRNMRNVVFMAIDLDADYLVEHVLAEESLARDLIEQDGDFALAGSLFERKMVVAFSLYIVQLATEKLRSLASLLKITYYTDNRDEIIDTLISRINDDNKEFHRSH